jgi:hypothetical protein
MAQGIGSKSVALNSDVQHVSLGDAVRDHISELQTSLQAQGADVVGTLLLGLPGVYERDHTPFPFLLGSSMRIRDEVKGKLADLADQYDAKEGSEDAFYHILDQVLVNNGVDTSKRDTEARPHALIVVLGATELETRLGRFHRKPRAYAFHSSSSRENIALGEKLNVFLVEPQLVLARQVAALSVSDHPPGVKNRISVPSPELLAAHGGVLPAARTAASPAALLGAITAANSRASRDAHLR